MDNRFNIRPAQPGEEGKVLVFIKRRAGCVRCSDEVEADEATLHQPLFEVCPT